jgi:hypothetical protein
MQNPHNQSLRATILCAIVLAPAIVLAQSTGELAGYVLDPEGAAIGSATVTLQGPAGPPVTRTTNDEGTFWIPALPPGTQYTLRIEAAGFKTFELAGVAVATDKRDLYPFTLEPGLVGEVVTVTGLPLSGGVDSLALLAPGSQPTEELYRSPGVLMDRVNVGGNESGQQASFVSGGSQPGQGATWSVDGVNITDYAAQGLAPTYYNTNAVEEFRIITETFSGEFGRSSGAQVNIVTKSGTNEYHGSLWAFHTPKALVGGANPRSFPGQPGLAETFGGSTLRSFGGAAATVGGPVIRDKMFFFAAYEGTRIRSTGTSGGLLLDSRTQPRAVRGNATVVPNPRLRFRVNADSNHRNRDGDGGFDREVGWDRTDDLQSFNLEGVAGFGTPDRSFFLRTAYASVLGNHAFNPRGGPSTVATQGVDRIWRNNFASQVSSRDRTQFDVNGGTSFLIGRASTRLYAGAQFFSFTDDTTFRWPGDRATLPLGANPIQRVNIFTTINNPVNETRHRFVFAQGVVTATPYLTFDVGFNATRRTLGHGPSRILANPLQPALAPAASFAAQDKVVESNTFAPQLGLAWTPRFEGGAFEGLFGRGDRTVIRGGFAVYFDPLFTDLANRTNRAGAFFFGSPAQAFNDTNLNGVLDSTEAAGPLIITGGVATSNPIFSAQRHQLDPGLEAARTDELRASITRLFDNGINLTFGFTSRSTSNVVDQRRLVADSTGAIRVATADDYVPGTPATVTGLDGTAIVVPTFVVRPGLTFTGGLRFANGARTRSYHDLEMAASKRFSSRFSLGGWVNISGSDWDVPSAFTAFDDPNDTLGAGDNDGGVIADPSVDTAQKTGVFLGSSWSYNINARYAAPWVNLGMNLYGRQGSVFAPFASLTMADGQTRQIETDRFGSRRHDDVTILDLRFDRTIRFRDIGLTLGADLFNAGNANTVLNRDGNLTGATPGHVRDFVGGRVLRLSARLEF